MFFNGYRVFEDINCLDRIFTKIQTRKFKNKRWVKKYNKKYSRYIPSKDFLVNERAKTMIGHPSAILALRYKIEGQERFSRMNSNNCFMI